MAGPVLDLVQPLSTGFADETRRAVLPASQPRGGRRELRLRRAHPRLEPFVGWHYVAVWDVPAERDRTANILFPPSVTLVSDLEAVTVRGVRRTTRRAHEKKPRGMLLGTSLRPGAFGVFSDRPAVAINDSYAPPAALLGGAGKDIGAELIDLGDDEDAYFDAVESILLDRAPTVDWHYGLVRSAERTMLESPASISVAEIASRESVSIRTLQRAFSQYVGVSPKWVLRRLRMRETLRRISEGSYESFASLAQELGYSDQPHLTRDFRDQTGLSPREYERAVRSPTEDGDLITPQGGRLLP